jgi:hypothetical protein
LPVSALKSSTITMVSTIPPGTPNCGQLAIRPRRALVRAYSIVSSTEPPHSPPTPMPCTKRRTVRMTAPQTPIWA